MVSHVKNRTSQDAADDVLIPIPAALVASIDDLVGAADRAVFVQEALRDRVERQLRLRALDALADRFESSPVPAWRTSETVERWVRDLRGEWDKAVPEHGEG